MDGICVRNLQTQSDVTRPLSGNTTLALKANLGPTTKVHLTGTPQTPISYCYFTLSLPYHLFILRPSRILLPLGVTVAWPMLSQSTFCKALLLPNLGRFLRGRIWTIANHTTWSISMGRLPLSPSGAGLL